ncbi:MAG: hypothetical protein ACJAVK_000177 [Akkermansiaceae bacterium]
MTAVVRGDISLPMRTIFKSLAALLLFFGSSTVASADFIDLSAGNVKVIFTLVTIDGFVVTKATATTSVTDSGTGTITVKSMTQVIVPDGSGGFNLIVTEETTVATITGPDQYEEVVTEDVMTTPLDAAKDPTGPETTTTSSETTTGVTFADLDLAPSSEFMPTDGELDEPIVVSPA